MGIRFSQWKQQDFGAKLAHSSTELKEFLDPIVNSGIDFLHSSMRRFWEPEFNESEDNLATWTKRISNIPTISVGSVGLDSDFIDMTAPANPASIEKAISDINKEKYDMVAVGRALLADPEWVVKMRDNKLTEVTPYTKEALAELR